MNQYINYNDQKYKVHHIKSIQSMTDEESQQLKEKYGFDIILKNEQFYHFCTMVENAKYYDIINEDPSPKINSEEII